jgi:clan AA aspartic protease
MTGTVNSNLEATVTVNVLLPSGAAVSLEAVIDTGFNGFLTLPADEIARLELPAIGFVDAVLGDGSEVELATFRARLAWEGQSRDVNILEAEGGPLLGAGLLADCELTVLFVANGRVSIVPSAAAS